MKTRCLFLFPSREKCTSLVTRTGWEKQAAFFIREMWLLTAATPLHLIVLLSCLSQGSIPCLASAHFCINSSVRELTTWITEFPETKALISEGNWNDSWKICQNQMDSRATEPLTHQSPFPLPFHQPSLPHSEPGISEKSSALHRLCDSRRERELEIARKRKPCTGLGSAACCLPRLHPRLEEQGTYRLQEHLLLAVPWLLQQVHGV